MLNGLPWMGGIVARTTSGRAVWIIALVLWLVPSLAVCSDPSENASATVIKVRGSLFLAKIVSPLGHSFAQEHPGTTVVVTGGGIMAAFGALSEMLADVVMAGRKAKPHETASVVRKGIQLEERLIGFDPVSVFVNSDLRVDRLTVEQLSKIYKGELVRWNEVHGPDVLVEPYSMEDTPRGPAGWFRSNVMESAEFGPRPQFVNEPLDVVKGVATSYAGIGFMGALALSTALEQAGDVKVTVIKLAADAENPAVPPSPDAIREGAYPLTRSLFFYWDTRTPKKLVPAFVDFCATRGTLFH